MKKIMLFLKISILVLVTLLVLVLNKISYKLTYIIGKYLGLEEV